MGKEKILCIEGRDCLPAPDYFRYYYSDKEGNEFTEVKYQPQKIQNEINLIIKEKLNLVIKK